LVGQGSEGGENEVGMTTRQQLGEGCFLTRIETGTGGLRIQQDEGRCILGGRNRGWVKKKDVEKDIVVIRGEEHILAGSGGNSML